MSAIGALFGRETSLAWGRGGGPLVSVGFYAGVATLLPLATGPEPERLAAIAPGAAWVALALAALLSLDRLFERDFEDGALDLMVHSPLPLELVCAIKCLGQWVATGLPLALAAPVAALALGAQPLILPLVFGCAAIGGRRGRAWCRPQSRCPTGRIAHRRHCPAPVCAAGDLRGRSPGFPVQWTALDGGLCPALCLWCRGPGAGAPGHGSGLPQCPVLIAAGTFRRATEFHQRPVEGSVGHRNWSYPDMNLKQTLALGGAVLALGFGGMAVAQQPSMGPPAGDHEAMQHHRDPAAMAARHADRLRVALQLRPDQEPALKALVAAMVPPEGMGMRMGKMGEGHEKMASMTTPERLDHMKAMMAQHEARFEQHSAAVKKFYAQLTPSQQKAFDAMSLKMGGRMGPGGGHEGGGRQGHGPGGRPGMGGHHGE